MSKSFKLHTSGDSKQQITAAGALLLILGIFVYILFYPIAGLIMGMVGIVLIITGNFAS